MRKHNRKTSSYILAITAILVLFNSCKERNKGNRLEEGVIEYKIEYIENEMQSLSTNLLPQKLILKFNQRYARTTLEGFMGLFSIEMIADFRKSENITLVKFFDNKYVAYGAKHEYSSLFKHMDNLNIELIDKKGKIAGYNTNIGQISNFVVFGKPCEVHYTNEIGRKDPNKDNPFNKLDGVMLYFPIEMHNLKMIARATQVRGITIGDNEFEVPDKYKTTTKANMDKIIDELLEK